MRIIPLFRNDPADYSCVAYWLLGENNAASDRNTLVDTGSAHPANLAFLFREMAGWSKGLGKRAVEQIVLTHAHYDHTGGLPGIDALLGSETYAWLPSGQHHHPVQDSMAVTVGDQAGFLLHTPGHSDDSICLFLPESGTLFSGDTLYRITDHLGSYPQAYVNTLERLAVLDIKTIYPGHGHPIAEGAAAFIRTCLDNVHNSLIQG